MSVKTIKVGSRQSQLAMWQTNYVIKLLKAKCPEYHFEIVPVKTKGDKILDVALAKIGDKGLFTKELEVAIFEEKIDFAVHSMKDLPTIIPEGLIIAAMTERHDPRDILISRNKSKFSQLPLGAIIGTSSLRRKSQLLSARPDLNFVDIRGNINTRLYKMETEKIDGIILAAAGVERLGLTEKITEKIDFSICLPAVGQGSIGIEIKSGNEEIFNIVRTANHSDTEWCIMAERALLKALEGGCQIPIGAYAKTDNDQLLLEAVVGSLDGKEIIKDRISGRLEDAVLLGNKLAQQLQDNGATKILDKIRQVID